MTAIKTNTQDINSDTHRALIRLVNGEFSSRTMRGVCEFLPSICFHISAQQYVKNYGSKLGEKAEKENARATVKVIIPTYRTQAANVKQMDIWLTKFLNNDIFAAILHGSLGTDEVVNYSDFDALVILNEDVLSDAKRLARVAHLLFKARKFMYRHDPLQHHGWFVLPKSALDHWPENYLPIAVLNNASLMTQNAPQALHIKTTINQGLCRTQFNHFAGAIEQNIASQRTYKNMYLFKSMISKILLLPTIYLQARDGEGVFKRESFEIAAKDFQAGDWAAIQTASRIRNIWPNVRPARPSFLSLRPGLIGNLMRRNFSAKIPPEILAKFDSTTKIALKNLIREMRAKLAQSTKCS